MPAEQKVMVSEGAVIKRINRKLAHEEEKLCVARSQAEREEMGRYFVVETGHHQRPKTAVSEGVCYVDVNPETLGRKLGVLAENEQLEDAQ
jgi:hypothetical protein